jgi:hypothetical protein
MPFRDTEILDFDSNGIERIADDENRAHVPYILSNEPSELWRRCFLSKTADGEARIIGGRVIYLCRKDKAAINRDGECWNTVAKYAEYANRRYREIYAKRRKGESREEEARWQADPATREFEEWTRNLKR